MSSFGWFISGFFAAQLIGLLTTTTPKKAAQNLKDWWAILRPRR